VSLDYFFSPAVFFPLDLFPKVYISLDLGHLTWSAWLSPASPGFVRFSSWFVYDLGVRLVLASLID